MMRKTTFILSIVAGIMLLAVSPSPLFATCPGGLIQPSQHAFGGFFKNCPDLNPVTGFIYVLGQATSINSASMDTICEDNAVPNAQGGVCQFEAGGKGDGNVTVSFDWGGSGTFPGCPNPSGLGDVGRNLVQVIANDGSSVLVTVGYSVELAMYAVDCAAVPSPSGLAEAISCSHSDAGLRITSLDTTTLCANLPPPKVLSDCDPNTFCGPGGPLGITPTCNTAQIPSTAPGRLFKKDGPCGTSPDPTLSLGWAAIGSPDASGNICIPVPRPADPNQCAYLGASGMIGGQETLAVVGSVQVAGLNAPSARALDVRATAVAGDIVVTWRTDTELELGGFNILVDTKGKGRVKVNDALIPPGAPYKESIARGKFLGGRTLYVEAVLNSGAKILSDPATF